MPGVSTSIELGRSRSSRSTGGDASAGEHVGTGDGAQIIEIGLDARDARCIERTRSRDRGLARLAPDDDLGEHRIVKLGHFRARFDPAFDARLLGKATLVNNPREAESGGGIFGIEAHFDGGALRREMTGVSQRLFTRGLTDHPFDQIDAEHCLGHRMFDLKPRVDLEEIEIVPRDIVDELDRASRPVGDASQSATAAACRRSRIAG